MHAEKQPASPDRAATGRQGSRPRVVIFDLSAEVRVEVMELPGDAKVGHRFCHRGRSWLVSGERTHSRVLIAEPEAN